MARLYLRKTLTGFDCADEASREAWTKFKRGEVYRADVVKPRSYRSHKLCMALLTLTYANQDRYTDFNMFRKAVALEAGHVNQIIRLSGEIVLEAGSLSYDALDEVQFQDVFRKMMAVCCSILGNVGADELEAEVSRFADFGSVAA